MATKNSSHHL